MNRRETLDHARAEPGYTEYRCRCEIRDLVRVHGFEEARDLIAGYLMDEADKRRVIDHIQEPH